MTERNIPVMFEWFREEKKGEDRRESEEMSEVFRFQVAKFWVTDVMSWQLMWSCLAFYCLIFCILFCYMRLRWCHMETFYASDHLYTVMIFAQYKHFVIITWNSIWILWFNTQINKMCITFCEMVVSLLLWQLIKDDTKLTKFSFYISKIYIWIFSFLFTFI